MVRSTDQLLAEIETFIQRAEMSATAFGEAAMGDRHLVRRLRAGGSVTLDTADAIRVFMKANDRPLASRKSKAEARSAA